MIDWIQQHAGWIAVSSILLFLTGIAIAAVCVMRLPSDYFFREPAGLRGPDGRIRPARLAGAIVLNLAGVSLAILGLVMCLPLVPGPGLLLVLAGLSMMRFPGKRALELALLRIPLVLRVVNRLRAGAQATALIVPPRGPAGRRIWPTLWRDMKHRGEINYEVVLHSRKNFWN